MNNKFFILGADDPEMSAIEQLLKETGSMYGYALDASGPYPYKRVTQESAYRVVDTCLRTISEHEPWWQIYKNSVEWYQIECDLGLQRPHIDHHREGDKNYNQPPANFLEASSIGQVILLLHKELSEAWKPKKDKVWSTIVIEGDIDKPEIICLAQDPAGMWALLCPCGYGRVVVPIPEDIVLTAAADHCLEAAYQGKCPGVNPNALQRFCTNTAAHKIIR